MGGPGSPGVLEGFVQDVPDGGFEERWHSFQGVGMDGGAYGAGKLGSGHPYNSRSFRLHDGSAGNAIKEGLFAFPSFGFLLGFRASARCGSLPINTLEPGDVPVACVPPTPISPTRMASLALLILLILVAAG